jgi:hypothetical protein
LRQKHDVARGRRTSGDARALHAQEVDVHPHEGLAHDVEARGGEEAVDVGHAAVGRVLHRQHRQIGAAAAHASIASSKVRQGSASMSGRVSWQAWCE